MCGFCRTQLLSLFVYGFSAVPRTTQLSLKAPPERILRPTRYRRPYGVSKWYHTAPQDTHSDGDESISRAERSIAKSETVVQRARETFGETLPKNFLSAEEYSLYERLYGAPIGETRPEDGLVIRSFEEKALNEAVLQMKILLKENDEGALEEVDYQSEIVTDPEESIDFRKGGKKDLNNEFENREESEMEESVGKTTESDATAVQQGMKDFGARMMLYRDAVAAEQQSMQETEPLENEEHNDIFDESTKETVSANGTHVDDFERFEKLQELEKEWDAADPDFVRAHVLTTAGSFRTSPTTLHMPKETLVDPITSILASSSNHQLTEVARRTFGGPLLPNSIATPKTTQHLHQAPIALEASQHHMRDMEANVYLAAIMPGAYASIMSVLVEIRKRLGSSWLIDLLNQKGGPSILDAGSGGAGVIAWREVLRAEWESIHTPDEVEVQPVPLGKATVITGSHELRNRVSRLVDNTTFLPRLPDYTSSRDLLIRRDEDLPSPRKQYDIVLAPHTLWTLKEDYMRKAQVQNLWSLLNPAGGVLVVIEKGVPRGFELVAGAREVLLKHQISSPQSTMLENDIQSKTEGRPSEKEIGMIIAPCTNHSQCPMYRVPGQSQGRKDYCHFSQRYDRPPYLQRLLGAKHQNHEDISFSYVAVQRGRDLRQTHGITQDHTATDAAFAGFENSNYILPNSLDVAGSPKAEFSPPEMLSLPRSIMPPLKKRGHVVLDLCTPAGRIERWIVTRSFSKQAYRDARKSKWGDLWALGARTRVLREPRVGSLKETRNVKRAKNVIKVNAGASDEEDIMEEREVKGLRPRAEKRTNNGRKPRIEQKKRKEYQNDDGIEEIYDV